MVIERGKFLSKHRAIDRFRGRRYSCRQSKEAFKFPIRDTEKKRPLRMTPATYTGKAAALARKI